MTSVEISVVIPSYNGEHRIRACLQSLMEQCSERPFEVIVVNDGSTDSTDAVVRGFAGVRLINQRNAGPASARNHGAQEASGTIVLFTDDDCVPTRGWLEAMLAPFQDAQVVGAKGAYRTHQEELVARFVQIEYQDRYRIMSAIPNIDFVDTYSAAFVRERFLEMNGYDTSFPTACAEDVELSYRMSARGWKMKFNPLATVYHTHPDTLACYIKKKYKFAFWRVLAVRKNPRKGLKDSHTPQLMKLQLLLLPALLASLAFSLTVPLSWFAPLVVFTAFLLSTIPFVVRASRKDPLIAFLSPLLLAIRACVQIIGVTAGLIYAQQSAGKELRRPGRLNPVD